MLRRSIRSGEVIWQLTLGRAPLDCIARSRTAEILEVSSSPFRGMSPGPTGIINYLFQTIAGYMLLPDLQRPEDFASALGLHLGFSLALEFIEQCFRIAIR